LKTTPSLRQVTIVSPGETVTFTTPTTPTTPTKPAKQPAVDVALGGGGSLLGIQVGAVLHWLAALGASEGASPVSRQMMAAVSERGRYG